MDHSDGSARLLRLRDGHSAPPTKVKFFSENGEEIISAGMVVIICYIFCLEVYFIQFVFNDTWIFFKLN